MTDPATCPRCFAPQTHGLLCHSCTSSLEHDLDAVPAVIGELDTTISRQARIGASGKGGPAHERWAYASAASAVADDLTAVLNAWARDLAIRSSATTAVVYRNRHVPAAGPFHLRCPHDSCRAMRTTITRDIHPAAAAASALHSAIDDIRKHPGVAELVDEIHDALTRARRSVDRPADRQFVGPCMTLRDGVTCTEDLYARPGATEVRCPACQTQHPVADRRVWMLQQAGDMLFTVREAAQMVGSFGERAISESTIRGYVSRGLLGYHGKLRGSSAVKLTELLTVIVGEASKPRGRRATASAT